MDESTLDAFSNDCRQKFRFLVEEYGFGSPTLQVNKHESSATITFKGQNLAIQCVYDWREDWVDLIAARLSGGELPSHFAVDETGRTVRGYVTELIRRLGARGFNFDKLPPSAHGAERWRMLLDNYASLLRGPGKQLLLDDATVFDA